MKLLTLVAAVGAALSVAAPAHAESDTFGQFLQTSGKIFKYEALNPGATLTVLSSPVSFVFDGHPSLVGPQVTLFNFSATTNLNPVVTDFSAGQVFNNANSLGGLGTLSFTLQNPVGGKTNLLTVSFNNALFSATKSGNGYVPASFSAYEDAPAGNFVSFSSDFFDFSNTFDKSFSLAFSGISGPAGASKLTLSGGRFPTFSADGTGTFSADILPAVPEPAQWATLITGFGLIGGALRLRRRETGAALAA